MFRPTHLMSRFCSVERFLIKILLGWVTGRFCISQSALKFVLPSPLSALNKKIRFISLLTCNIISPQGPSERSPGISSRSNLPDNDIKIIQIRSIKVVYNLNVNQSWLKKYFEMWFRRMKTWISAREKRFYSHKPLYRSWCVIRALFKPKQTIDAVVKCSN